MANNHDNKLLLLNEVKAQVKKLMEEAVVCSYVHEENNIITALCASVDAVLNHGLRSGFFDLFEENRTLLLCRRIAKRCPSAQQVLDRMDFHENTINGTRQTASPRLSWNTFGLLGSGTSPSSTLNRDYPSNRLQVARDISSQNYLSSGVPPTRLVSGSIGLLKSTQKSMPADPRFKHFWIRVAVLEKMLDKIVHFLATNSSQYYEKNAILSDPCHGLLLADLLHGVCAIDYSRTRTSDHLFTDPPVSELIKRHGMSGSLMSRQLPYVAPFSNTRSLSAQGTRAVSNPNICHTTMELSPSVEVKTSLCLQAADYPTSRSNSAGSLSPRTNRSSTTVWSNESASALSGPRSARLPKRMLVMAAKEHVESMHQSFRPTLIYGKNNVFVPTPDTDVTLPGYLAIHDYGTDKGIYVSWIPNWAIANYRCDDDWKCIGTENQPDRISPIEAEFSESPGESRDVYWDYAIQAWLRDLVYIHCHTSGLSHSVVFITKEGLQLTPLLFDSKNHLDAFMSYLEQALTKHDGRLDPSFDADPQIDPTPKHENPSVPTSGFKMPSLFSVTWDSSKLRPMPSSPRLLGRIHEQHRQSKAQHGSGHGGRLLAQHTIRYLQPNQSESPISRVYMISMEKSNQKTIVDRTTAVRAAVSAPESVHNDEKLRVCSSTPDVMETVCATIRKRILSESFQRWYSCFRKMRLLHLRLKHVVSSELATADRPTNAAHGVTLDLWNRVMTDPMQSFTFDELCRHVYFGNCDPSIRKQVWPYLLGVYSWGADSTELTKMKQANRNQYELALNEWKIAQTKAPTHEFPNGSVKTLPKCPLPISENTASTNEESDHQTHPKLQIQKPSVDISESSPNQCQYRHSITHLDSVASDVPDMGSATPEAQPSGSGSAGSTDSTWLCRNNTSASYTPERLKALILNLYRIDKDVSRCDRNHTFFSGRKNPSNANSSVLADFPNDQMELTDNLLKLRNIICTWVWLHLDVGYIQGMCDLLAPLLVTLEDEPLTFACFTALMYWMLPNFPTVQPRSNYSSEPPTNGVVSQTPKSTVPVDMHPDRPTLLLLSRRQSQMSSECTSPNSACPSEEIINFSPTFTDSSASPQLPSVYTVPSPYVVDSRLRKLSHMNLRFEHLTGLIELFDPELRKFLSLKAIDDQPYFCYRWLLLDFKREFGYDDVFTVWEIIWAARRLVCYDFGLFLTFAMLQYYRDIMLYYDMEMTEIIRFYNEMTERHDVAVLLELARSLVFQVQTLLQDT